MYQGHQGDYKVGTMTLITTTRTDDIKVVEPLDKLVAHRVVSGRMVPCWQGVFEDGDAPAGTIKVSGRYAVIIVQDGDAWISHLE